MGRRKDQLRSDAACSEAPAAGDFEPPPLGSIFQQTPDICDSPEGKMGMTLKRTLTWLKHETVKRTDSKRNVPRLIRAEGGHKYTRWQHQRGITLLHSCAVETS